MNIIMKNYVPGSDYGEVYRLFTNDKINELIISKPDHNAMNIFSKWLDKKLEDSFNDFKVLELKKILLDLPILMIFNHLMVIVFLH